MQRSRIPVPKGKMAEIKLSKASPIANPTESVLTGNGSPNDSVKSPTSNGRVKRKQWVLHEGPNGSLQRLRMRMAEEGCGHSQVALAKQYLAEENFESDQIAVHWLLKAADQGHFEGLDLLKTCLENNKGITESNFHKIRNLLEMSRHERAARLGAKSLFSNIAQGGEFVTTHQLEHWLEETLAKYPWNDNQQEEDDNLEIDSSSLILGGDLLSEQHLVSAASDYAAGHFPPLLRLLDLGSKQKFKYFCKWLSHSLLNLFDHHLSLPFIVTIMIFLTLLNNSLEVLLNLQYTSVAIMLFWVVALAAATIYTAQACYLVRDWNVFHGWSILLSQHSQQLLEPAIPENSYIARTFPNHFARLLIATVPCISLQPALQLIRTSMPQPGLWIPYGELGVLASLLCSTCLDSCFGIRIDDLLCLFGWILWRAEISLWSSLPDDEEAIENDTYLNFHVFHPALSIRIQWLAIVGFALLVFLYARRLRQFSHFSHFLAWSLPHFSSLVWLFLAIDWLKSSTYEAILRGIVICVVAILLRSNCSWLTKANLVLCCLTSYSTGSAIGLTPWIALGLAIFLIVTVQLSARFVALTSQRYWISESLYSFLMRWPQHVWTGVKTTLLFACIATLSFRLMTYFEEDIDLERSDLTLPPSGGPRYHASATGGRLLEDIDIESDLNQLTWEHYCKYCYNPSASNNKITNAATQLACSSLNGVVVDWEGVVREISVDHHRNWVESIVKLLPSRWGEWLSCRFGEKWPECDQNETYQPQSFEFKRCQVLRQINLNRGRYCHLNRFSKYRFRFEVEPKFPKNFLASFFDSKLTVDLLAGPKFQSYGFLLSPGHVIRFQGALITPQSGNVKPEVELISIECLSCQNDENRFSNLDRPPSSPAVAWPDVITFAISTLQGTADFVLPNFIRLNVTQLLYSE